MNKPVTIHDMAKILNVSPATVSRVVSNSSYPVSQELKKKIKGLAKELGYTPNMLGRHLKTKNKNSMTIGVVIPSISNPFYADVVLGIEEIARKHGYQVLLCNSYQDPKLEAEYLQTLLEKQVRSHHFIYLRSKGFAERIFNQRPKNHFYRSDGQSFRCISN